MPDTIIVLLVVLSAGFIWKDNTMKTWGHKEAKKE
jgi:hypothetical protein